VSLANSKDFRPIGHTVNEKSCAQHIQRVKRHCIEIAILSIETLIMQIRQHGREPFHRNR